MHRFLTAAIAITISATALLVAPAATAAGVTEIVIVGGPEAIDDAVLEHLATCSAVPVRRVAGPNRHQTAAAASADAFSASDEVFVATASDYPDAVAAGAPAALAGAPVLLTDPDLLPQATRDEISRLGATRIFLLGGEAAVSPAVQEALSSYGEVIRIAGPDRYATTAAISRERFGSPDTVFVATGDDFPDAVAAAPAAAAAGAPILLVSRDAVPAPTRAELERLDPATVVILGGAAAISEAVASQMPGNVVRVAGSNRFATAAAISRVAFTAGETDVIYVTTGLAAPDALAGGPAAGHRGGPVLLATRTGLPAATAAEISRLTGLPCAPFEAPTPEFRTGLEPGTVLGGHVLPLDWSQRPSPCGVAEETRLLAATGSGHPALCPGDASPAVADLQRLLQQKLLYRMPITGGFDEATAYAVATFHKLIGPTHPNPATAQAEWLSDPPPEDWTPADWEMLESFHPLPPKPRDGQPDRVEVDIGRQVLYLIGGDEVRAIIPVSTGAGTGVRGCTWVGCGAQVTPRTDRLPAGSVFYTQHSYANGWSPRPGAWSIYKAIFYRGNYGEWNYGIHGYRSVPHYPASHGCIRVTVWDMDHLRPFGAPALVWIGMPIHVWDG